MTPRLGRSSVATPSRRRSRQAAAASRQPAISPSEPVQAIGPSSHQRPTPVEQEFSIPRSYGKNRLVLMVKDPWGLFAYWEIQPSTERAAHSQLLPHEVVGLQTILRVYDVTSMSPPELFGSTPTAVATGPEEASQDIALSGLATNWYLPVQAPHHTYVVDIGLLTNNGRFIVLARSKEATTPPCGPSAVVDSKWKVIDEHFRKLAGAVNVQCTSSPMGSGRLTAHPTGGTPPAPAVAPGEPPVHGFWCRVHAEVILYGTTEPRAAVQIQGQPVPVRPDGTFSVRMALPEGTQTVLVEVTSPDGRQTWTVTPIVTRVASSLSTDSTASSRPAASQIREESHTDESRKDGAS